MAKRLVIAAAAAVLSGCSAAGTHDHPRVLSPPAGTAARSAGVRAEVLEWWGESLVCVIAREEDAGGGESPIWKLDGTSPDGGHGFRVEHAAWSPSGRFLAIQLASSGGHQPALVGLVLYDLEERIELDLDDLLDAEGSGLSVTGDGGAPAWLPDDRLAFHALADGGEIRGLVCDPARAEVFAERASPREESAPVGRYRPIE